MTVFGMLRIRNEARWIVDVVKAMLPICERVFILDDHSDDGTPELCEVISGVTLFRSPFVGLDERRDKNFLLGLALACVPEENLTGNIRSPFWALAIDGDELLDDDGPAVLRAELASTEANAFRLPVRYLWDNDLTVYSKQRQIRVDGVYRQFARPSLFRLFNREFHFMSTPWGGNLHCSSIPQQLLHDVHSTLPCAPLWHLGYNDRADRLRKYHWYNSVDPGNQGEDEYRHCVQGDVPEVPATARLLHAGPLELMTVGGKR